MSWMSKCVRWRHIVLACLSILGIFAIYDFADLENANVGVAAWVQAIGVFAAVLGASELSRRQALAEINRQRDQRVASVQAVIAKALSVVDNTPSGVELRRAGGTVTDPRIVLRNVHEALTPMRIHELPDHTLVSVAIDVKTDIEDLLAWLNDNPTVTEPGGNFFTTRGGTPPGLTDRVTKTKADCEAFLQYTASGKWK